MTARRSVGKTQVAKSLWYPRKGVAELRAALDSAAKEGRAAVNNGLVGMGESSLAESGNGET